MCVLLLLLFYYDSVSTQFYDPSAPWQFAGYAAVNVPATDNNGISPYIPSYSPFQQNYQSSFQPNYQQFSSNNRFDQQQQQQFQQNSLISSPHNSPLLPNVISIPKRENGNSLKSVNGEHEKELHQGELPDFSRSGTTLEHATYLSLINDKENFQASGCGWDLIRLQCHDLFGLCKGGCRDFAIAINSPIHDCRCVPFGYLALVKLAGR